MNLSADDVLSFWFTEAGPKQWFNKSLEFDQRVTERFSNLVTFLASEIEDKGVSPFEGSPRGDLASVIALDQFPRNIHRGSAQSFAYDDAALALVLRALERKSDERIPNGERSFLFMPLMHSEDRPMQNLSVECFQSRMEDHSNLSFAIDHRDIILRFGRFPHRNEVLGRVSTEGELSFLNEGGFSG